MDQQPPQTEEQTEISMEPSMTLNAMNVGRVTIPEVADQFSHVVSLDVTIAIPLTHEAAQSLGEALLVGHDKVAKPEIVLPSGPLPGNLRGPR